MASPTKKSKVRRKLNQVRSGRKRKNATKIKGSTAPDLPLNRPCVAERLAHGVS
jgi:hypothetical protein